VRISKEEKEKIKRENDMRRNEWEWQNLGNYMMIYPSPKESEMHEYENFMTTATDLFEDFTGARKGRKTVVSNAEVENGGRNEKEGGICHE
jgi:hypothetical protein